MIKTKIIITYGPALSSYDTFKKILRNVDIVRINFSHGDKQSWLEAAGKVKRISRELKKEIALFADLPGPKVRVQKMKNPIHLKKGDIVKFSSTGKEGSLKVSYNEFHLDARKGGLIEIGDGVCRLQIREVKSGIVTARALEDGLISSRKGVNLLGVSMNLKSPTKDDIRLASFAAQKGFDFVGMSFVRSAKGIKELAKASHLPIIAKVERREALENIDEIAKAADVIMVARGDLAEEVSLENIPEAQRKIINASREAGKPVIVATQLLTSMINNPTPTRAEVNDIASAVMEGTDCLMLSDETTVGKYPQKAVEFLVRAISAAEATVRVHDVDVPKITELNAGIAFAAAGLADAYSTDCIFMPTKSGSTAKIISRLRPNTQTIALAMHEDVRKRLSIYYGIRTLPIKRYRTTDEMFEIVKKVASQRKMKSYIIVSGSPNKPGSTDTMKYIENRQDYF